jgi:hypothetical protein
MKPLAISLILLGISYNAYEQSNTGTDPKSPNPEFVNHVYYYASDSLLALEQNQAHQMSKTKAFGYGGSESGFSMSGEKSPIRLKAVDNMTFAVKMGGGMMMDPSMSIKLYHFNAKKGNREAIVSSYAGPYSHKSSSDNPNEVSFNLKKSGNEVYLLIPASKLAPGEYGFLNMMSMSGGMNPNFTVFAFGVD